ncbi:hypothetical protein GGI1_22731 [Acidithiobacillus sp. GGI-221]|nr:hypothetical protein GGI1_22731 [Acidithiobacillus sp. GGI-221]
MALDDLVEQFRDAGDSSTLKAYFAWHSGERPHSVLNDRPLDAVYAESVQRQVAGSAMATTQRLIDLSGCSNQGDHL